MDANEELTLRVTQAAETLEALRDDFAALAQVEPELRTRLLTAAGQVARPGPWAKRQLAKAARQRRKVQTRGADERLLARTAIRVKRAEPEFKTPLRATPKALSEGERAGRDTERLLETRTCYVCKVQFRELHSFYDAMCPACADLNWRKRNQTAELPGRVAVVTGARVKIGYQTAILMLRAGCRVIATTRFPRDAAQRYAREADFAQWADRLEIHGLDLRHTPSVEMFCRGLDQRLERLDFIINNACQTVRRPVGFYRHLMEAEQRALAELSPAELPLLSAYEQMRAAPATALATTATQLAGLHNPAALSQVALLDEDLDEGPTLFPAGQLDADLQQVDLRGRNSWRLTLAEVSAVELLEVHLVNAVAPFILNARLKAAMLRQSTRDKHIVNVSAMEGQFYRRFKTDKHPHTNMAKASLNMMTRTSAADYIKDGIHMNCVDTGWVTDEDPAEIAQRKIDVHRFHPPLDIVDGAARICDPIFNGFNTGAHEWGLFFKDYKPTDW